MNPSVKPGRVELLDAWRASAVIVMVFWHLCWDLTMYGTLPARVMFEQPMLGIRYYIICSFVLLSGISCRFSSTTVRMANSAEKMIPSIRERIVMFSLSLRIVDSVRVSCVGR